jgi:hypothetical protein
VKVFLDKDDLKTGAGAEYIDLSQMVLVFCTAKFFKSRACARELVRAVLTKKPLIALLEPNADKVLLTDGWVQSWNLTSEVSKWGVGAIPSAETMTTALFADDPIEWNRLSDFEMVTLRLIGNRLLKQSLTATYIQGEASSQPLKVPTLTNNRTFHLYCSPHNVGAESVAIELSELFPGAGRGSSFRLGVGR